jgi:hypothetical protein
MVSLSATAALQLPVRLHGIQLGRPTDVLLDVDTWNAVGYVVHCGDESTRFLPYGACQTTSNEIVVQSALMLLEDVAFYEKRGSSFRALIGGSVTGGGALRDVVLGSSGAITELDVEESGARRRVPSAGRTVVATRASAA